MKMTIGCSYCEYKLLNYTADKKDVRDALRNIEIHEKFCEQNPKNFKCPCGKKATYICDCGCLCCGEDPCMYGCGGSVRPLNEGLNLGIKPKIKPEGGK